MQDRGYPIDGYELCSGGCGYWVVPYHRWRSMPEHEQLEAEADGFRLRATGGDRCSPCKWRPPVREAILAAYEEGLAIDEIVERTGASRDWVQRIGKEFVP